MPMICFRGFGMCFQKCHEDDSRPPDYLQEIEREPEVLVLIKLAAAFSLNFSLDFLRGLEHMPKGSSHLF